jgi:hypothetical protein
MVKTDYDFVKKYNYFLLYFLHEDLRIYVSETLYVE